MLATEPEPYLQVFGRFHIVLLHLPIGLLPGMALLEFGAAVFRRPIPRGSVLTLAIMTALVAGAALASGLVLSGEKRGTDALAEHKLAAIIMTSTCALLPILAAFQKRAAFRVCLLAAIGLSVWAGHVGGRLTHGKDFLTQPLKPRKPRVKPQPVTPVNVAAKPISFTKHVAPIFKRVCSGCHNADDFEGELDLTSKDGILCVDREEGEGVVVPGKPNESFLIELCEYPEDDEDRMPPPDEETQLKKEELATLRTWILQGCKFD